MQVQYTSAQEIGQIYMPEVNWLLLVSVLLAVVGFGSSSALASAYGIAGGAGAATAVFLSLDTLLVVSCSLKFFQGGWFPLVLGLAIFMVMATWRRGRELLIDTIRHDDPELLPFITALSADVVHRVPRTAIYAVANPDTMPQALMHNLKHNQVLHERNLILTVVFHDVPGIAFEERVQVTPLVPGFWPVQVNYGFKNKPDIPKALELCQAQGLHNNCVIELGTRVQI